MYQQAKIGDWEAAQWKLLANPSERERRRATVPVCLLSMERWGTCWGLAFSTKEISLGCAPHWPEGLLLLLLVCITVSLGKIETYKAVSLSLLFFRWLILTAGLGVLQSLCFILDPVWLKIPFVQLTIVGQNPVMLGHGKKTWRWNGLDTKDLCSVSIETSQGWYLPQEVLKPQIFYFENLIRWWIYHSAITFKGIIYCTALDGFG